MQVSARREHTGGWDAGLGWRELLCDHGVESALELTDEIIVPTGCQFPHKRQVSYRLNHHSANRVQCI